MAKKKSSKSTKPTPQEKIKRSHKRAVRAVFRLSGFDRIPDLAEKTFTYNGQTAEFDDAYMYENLLVLLEYTTSQESDVKGHLKGKKIIYDLIEKNPKNFWQFLREKYKKFDEKIIEKGDFSADRLILKIVYCSYNDISTETKSLFSFPIFFDFPLAKYFEKIAYAIRWSARDELLDFLGIDVHEVRYDGKYTVAGSTDPYHGSILPEEASGFPPGYKVVSFYADPAALLKRCFVVRRNGWRASSEAYQRMLMPSKIEAIRQKITQIGYVAINNLIVTMPPQVHPILEGGKTIEISTLTKTTPVKISLPASANSMGIIDGQHRLFAYYQSKGDTQKIKDLRNLQNLLVTGIIYPEDTKEREKERFEAELFLTINSNQTSASSDLRQEIEVLLNPYTQISIAKQVIEKLSENGPLFSHIERYFYDKGKLKTSSIVSYALSQLVKFSGDDSLFLLFKHDEKEKLIKGQSGAALNEYIQFCASTINQMLSAVKSNVGNERWTTDKKQANRVLTVTYINSFLIVMRKIIQSKQSLDFNYLNGKLTEIGKFNFKDFHSSQYNRMAEKIFDKYFS